MMYTKFHPDSTKGAEVTRGGRTTDRHTERQTNVYFNRIGVIFGKAFQYFPKDQKDQITLVAKNRNNTTFVAHTHYPIRILEKITTIDLDSKRQTDSNVQSAMVFSSVLLFLGGQAKKPFFSPILSDFDTVSRSLTAVKLNP